MPNAHAFGLVPPEPVRRNNLADTAPAFAAAVRMLLGDLTAQGFPPIVFEALRSAERQAWLYGFGRTYDDGRGKVTGAATIWTSWHGFGLAADLVHARRFWSAPGFFTAMRLAMPRYGLKPCTPSDWPHVQFGRCKKRPSARAKELFDEGGLEAVWDACGAGHA